jgi:hypothetical protein
MVKGADQKWDSAVLAAGLTGAIGDHVSLGIRYDVNLSSDQVVHTAAGRVIFRW